MHIERIRCLDRTSHLLRSAHEALSRGSAYKTRHVKQTKAAVACAVRSLLLIGFATCAYAQQSPWGMVAQKMGEEFTGPIARGFSLVAIVVGGLTLAFSDGSGKRTIGGLVMGLGMALGAAQFMAWLFS